MRGKMKTFYKLMLPYKTAQGKQIRGFHTDSGRTTRHSLELKDGQVKTDKRKYLFILRVIKLWNSLPKEVVETKNLTRLIKRLDIISISWISRVIIIKENKTSGRDIKPSASGFKLISDNQ